ncbi:hypothetical protein F5Y19DRAFT_448960 [Xylariaceae sp. FL1651]|nr:hypothetical protein F5Y19DRAFT_448960 [Xylariaceae sp. FL1651]
MQSETRELDVIMDGDAGELDPWRRTCLGDEPIYCAAPSLSNSDDIICLGSDNENDKPTKIAKRLRYEEQGHRYLQGRPLRILSASLRGPFDKASGWQNPWLPKSSSQYGQSRFDSSLSSSAVAAIQCDNGMPVQMLSSENDGPTQDQGDSMDCHLPSPQSHRDFQFFNDSPCSKKWSHIEAWAKHVHEDALEKDEFWAPDQGSTEVDNDSNTKRPIGGGDWLKRRPAKRKRPDASQSTTAAASTPTPIPPITSKSRKNKASEYAKRSASRSFEMATPSSSPGQGLRKSQGSTKYQPITSDNKDDQHMLSTISSGASQTFTEPPFQEIPRDDTESSETMSQKQPPSEIIKSDQEISEKTGFQNCADESFCYRARQPCQVTPPAAYDAIATDYPLYLTQTETPISSKPRDAVIISNSESHQYSDSKASPNPPKVDNAEHAENLTIPADSTAAGNEAGNEAGRTMTATPGPFNGQVEPGEYLMRTDSSPSTSLDGRSTSDASVAGPSSDITSNKLRSEVDTCDAVPQTILEVTGARDTSPVPNIGHILVNQEPLLNDGSTLICDPMEVSQVADVQTTKLTPSLYLPDNSSFTQSHLTIATDAVNANKAPQCDESTTADTISSSAGYTVQTTLHPSMNSSQSSNNKHLLSVLQKGVTISDSGINTTASRHDEDNPRCKIADQNVPPGWQEPRLSLSTVDAAVINYDNELEQVEDKGPKLPTSPLVVILESPALLCQSPAIRASQQSPWAQDIIMPTVVARQEEDTSIVTGTTSDAEIPENRQRQSLQRDGPQMTCSGSLPPMPTVSSEQFQSPSYRHGINSSYWKEQGAASPMPSSLRTPTLNNARQSTPEADISIKSFSNFNFFSPQQQVPQPGGSIGRSIFGNGRCSSARDSAKSSRRVSFAPLPYEDDGALQLSSTRLIRAASPPPPMVVGPDGENVDGKYQNHFNAMNRRISGNKVQRLQYQKRLLPSSSQQRPESPSIEAMAKAFREADAQQSEHPDSQVNGDGDDEGETGHEGIDDKPQSPWQHESQGIDDVADVIGNLDQFLDVWDVDAELNRTRAELNEAERHQERLITDMNVLQGVGVW